MPTGNDITKTVATTATIIALATTAITLARPTLAAQKADESQNLEPTVTITQSTADTVTENLISLEKQNEDLKHQLADATSATEDAKAEAEAQKKRADKEASRADTEKKRADEAEKKAKDLQEKLDAAEAIPPITQQQANSDAADLVISQAQVSEWAARIDRYLAGTALANQGTTFAQAACDFQVDPRLSPAISVIESSAGAYLAADHNAWGWGGPGNWSSWPDWETAIRAHVRGLAENGYVPFDQEAGTRYCDANYWSHLKPILEEVGRE